MLSWQSFPTPFGSGAVVESDAGIERIYLPRCEHGQKAFDPARVAADYPGAVQAKLSSAPILARCFEHGAGDAASLVERIAWPTKGRPFLCQVWRLCAGIPAGSTMTYGELAARTGQPRATRAVGTAMSRNPWPLAVPCHRVLGVGGRLANYGGGLAMKARLLELEGARFRD